MANDKTHLGLHENCFKEWFAIDVIIEFIDLVAKNVASQDPMGLKEYGSFFHGKFKKYSGVLKDKHYILKVQENDYPELPATEYLCNQLARELKIEVPDFYLIRFQENIDAFVCENFMQKRESSNLIHIYHFLEPSSKKFNCEYLLKVIESKTQRRDEIERFIELTLFDALIGNHDRHGRNLALIQSPQGFQLSPFYDNPSYLGTESDFMLGACHDPRGQIYTAHSTEPKIQDYVKEWERLGYKDFVNKFRNRIELPALIKIIDESFVSSKRKEAMKKLIRRRFQELIS